MSLFTIILVTTGDRGPLLPLVLRCVQLQSLADWELLVIGDGVDAQTLATIEALSMSEPRIRFFPHVKHARRGEPYRHAALAQARGKYVAYLCDRDLWLHDHLATLAQALKHADFVHSAALAVEPDGRARLGIACALQKRWQRKFVAHKHCPIVLSSVAHSLSAYHQLPFGWRTTPPGIKTDHYMWQQFLAAPLCRTRSAAKPTLLYFNRGDHPGWPTAKRHAELLGWAEAIDSAAKQDQLRAVVLGNKRERVKHLVRSWLWWRPSAARIWTSAGLAPLRSWLLRISRA